MKVGAISGMESRIIQIEDNTQVISFSVIANTNMETFNYIHLLKSVKIKVYNSKGIIIPSMTLHEAVMLNLDVQEFFAYFTDIKSGISSGNRIFTCSVVLANDGFIKKTVYVDVTSDDAEIDVDIYSSCQDSIPTEMRVYNNYSITSPAMLPQNSLVIVDRSRIQTIEVDGYIMEDAEFDLVTADVNAKNVINAFFFNVFDKNVLLLNTGSASIRLTPIADNDNTPLYTMSYQLTSIGQQVAQEFSRIKTSIGTVGKIAIADNKTGVISKIDASILASKTGSKDFVQLLARNIESVKKQPVALSMSVAQKAGIVSLESI